MDQRQARRKYAPRLGGGVGLGDVLRDAEGPGVLHELTHLLLVDRVEADVDPVVAHVAGARQRELLGLGLDERRPPLLWEREAHHRAVAREREIDDPADPKLDAAAHERLAAAGQRACKRADVVDRHHDRSRIRLSLLVLADDANHPRDRAVGPFPFW